MAKNAGSDKPAKPTRAEKKATRAQRRSQRRETFRNLLQAFKLTRQNDPRLIPLLVGAGVGAAAVVYLLFWLLSGNWWMGIPFAIFAAVIAALLLFSRRAQSTMFRQAEGQPGAAGWFLSQQLKGDWRLTQAVAGNAQFDAVHRLVGRPGVVLVGEGTNSARVRGLIAAEKKNMAKLIGETPIYDFVIGTGEDDIKLSKISRALLKLPANLSKEQVSSLDKRLKALGGARTPLPQGPLPQGAKMRNVQRTVRRRG
jgi:hypothetical protein